MAQCERARVWAQVRVGGGVRVRVHVRVVRVRVRGVRVRGMVSGKSL